ncbi:trimeric intracellular cation channel type 1B.1 [Eurytemora carolleeae]|uniref:trimeric intracellular cation channel type 1B.1 n=1 Tax=Eurytemora carolleeae TaxID=1294199 RepID=UPI000C79302B|nr:trimeric intracellular cation channel type 1B.1 [Eurytemora carolleeae]|eukprot:XP_023331794.1 trimeric intracellular cation channel type 1B.1-like [Eurytemora affinis]
MLKSCRMFDELGLSAAKLQSMPANWFPYFDICHYILAALAVRKEVGVPFSRNNPLATWVATLTASFAGSMIANPLLGKPVFGAVSDEYNLYLATLVWWAVFYSPADIVYKVLKNQAVYLPICVLKEIYRAKKTLGGISDAAKLYPDHELIQITVGLIKGNGSGFMKPITRLVCGTWVPGSSELLKMSVTSKGCLVAAVLMVADKAGHIPAPVSGDLLYLGIVGVFILVKLAPLLGEPIDPFKPLQKAVHLLTGDLWNNVENIKED